MSRRTEPRTTKVAPHAFEADDSLPPDFWGRSICKRCRVVGKSGDDRHPEGAAPVYPDTPPEARSAELRRLGERDDDDDDVTEHPYEGGSRMTFTDRDGDEHTVSAGIAVDDGERRVYYDSDGYTPQEARRLAAALIAEADGIERALVAIPGGAA